MCVIVFINKHVTYIRNRHKVRELYRNNIVSQQTHNQKKNTDKT